MKMQCVRLVTNMTIACNLYSLHLNVYFKIVVLKAIFVLLLLLLFVFVFEGFGKKIVIPVGSC